MLQRVEWDAGFATGHSLLDRQHEALLALCARLADLCGPDDPAFDEAFERLKVLAREHFETEAPLLARDPQAEAEDLQTEREEYDYLLEEVATTAHFDRAEVQRFLALWWLGHVSGQVERLRALPAAG